MPTNAESGWAADTSFAVAALDGSHTSHPRCRDLARTRQPALAGHAYFETFAVLTRLPGRARVGPTVAVDLLRRAFPERCWLDPGQHDELAVTIGRLGFAGGSTYDALVAEAARVHSRVLLTRDLRAVRIYEQIGVQFEVVR